MERDTDSHFLTCRNTSVPTIEVLKSAWITNIPNTRSIPTVQTYSVSRLPKWRSSWPEENRSTPVRNIWPTHAIPSLRIQRPEPKPRRIAVFPKLGTGQHTRWKLTTYDTHPERVLEDGSLLHHPSMRIFIYAFFYLLFTHPTPPVYLKTSLFQQHAFSWDLRLAMPCRQDPSHPRNSLLVAK